MPTLAVGMSRTHNDQHMPTASVGMAPNADDPTRHATANR